MGNILSFMLAALTCDKLVLRIEDLDPQRSKKSYIEQIFRDLDYLGFEWDGLIFYQSKRSEVYQEAFNKIDELGLIYPCFCSRADLHSAQAPHFGDELVYANTCRGLTEESLRSAFECSSTKGARQPSWRVMVPDKNFEFQDYLQGFQSWNLSKSSGDFILRRSDGVYAYQLAVVVDDAAQGVNQVTRGVDLLSSVARQRYLQDLLDLPKPDVCHIPLLVNKDGVRLSKRNADASLAYLIDDKQFSGKQILAWLAYLSGIIPEPSPMRISDLKKHASVDALAGKKSIVWRSLS